MHDLHLGLQPDLQTRAAVPDMERCHRRCRQIGNLGRMQIRMNFEPAFRPIHRTHHYGTRLWPTLGRDRCQCGVACRRMPIMHAANQPVPRMGVQSAEFPGPGVRVDVDSRNSRRSVIRRGSSRRPRAHGGLLLTGLGSFAGDWLITHPAAHARAVPLLAAPAVTLGVDDAGPRTAAACVFHDRSCFSRISSCRLQVHAHRHQPHVWFAAILAPIRGRDLRALFPCREAMRPSLPRPTVREIAEDAMDLPISASGRFRAVQAETVGPLGLEPRTKGL